MMSEAEFFAGITGNTNDLARVVQALRSTGIPFCLIGDLAVNQYVEPAVTLDADFAITASDGVRKALEEAGFVVEPFPHSMSATQPGSRLRIQITINNRYGSFPSRAVEGKWMNSMTWKNGTATAVSLREPSRVSFSEFRYRWLRSRMWFRESSGPRPTPRAGPASGRRTKPTWCESAKAIPKSWV